MSGVWACEGTDAETKILPYLLYELFRLFPEELFLMINVFCWKTFIIVWCTILLQGRLYYITAKNILRPRTH